MTMSTSSAPAANGVAGVRQLDVHPRPAGWECGRDCRDLHAGCRPRLPWRRGRGRCRRISRRRRAPSGSVGSGCCPWRTAHAPCRGVRALERGQVDHADGKVERERLGVRLDRASGEPRRACLGSHLVDPGQAVQEPPERRLGGRHVGQDVRPPRCGGHSVSVRGEGRRPSGRSPPFERPPGPPLPPGPVHRLVAPPAAHEVRRVHVQVRGRPASRAIDPGMIVEGVSQRALISVEDPQSAPARLDEVDEGLDRER